MTHYSNPGPGFKDSDRVQANLPEPGRVLTNPLSMSSNAYDPILYAKASRILQYPSGAKRLAAHSFVGNEIVIDLGCGDGALTSVIARRVPQGKVIGIDTSSEMLSYARFNYGACLESSAPILFLEHDIGALQQFALPSELVSQGNKVDLIFSNYSLHWLSQPAQLAEVFRNIAHLLTRDGVFLAQIPIYGAFEEVVQAANEVASGKRWCAYYPSLPVVLQLPSWEDISEALDRSSFEDFSQHRTTNPVPLTSHEFEDLFLSSFRSFILPIPELERARFAQEVSEAIKANAQGLFPPITEVLAEVRAVKGPE